MLKQDVIVISASRYKITDDKGSISAEGTTVRFLMGQNLDHTENEGRTVKGLVPAKCNLSYMDYDKLTTVPGLYSAELSYSVDSKGVAKITPSNFTLISPLNLANGNAPARAASTGFGTVKQ